MVKPYRSKSRLVLDVLRAVKDEGTAQTTRLLLLANLSHPRLQEHLKDLVGKGWIVEVDSEGRKAWQVTEEGQRVIRELQRIEDAMQDFGLAL